MSSYFVMPRQQAFGNGVVAPGAKLYFFESGTTTPKEVYTDAVLTTPASNPVVADSNGRFATIYLDGTYKVVQTTSADVTVWTEDEYQGAAGGGDLSTLEADLASADSGKGASKIGYRHPALLGTAVTAQDALDDLPVQAKRLGISANGSDQSAALLSALASVKSIQFSPGAYRFDDLAISDLDERSLIGHGYNTIFNLYGTVGIDIELTRKFAIKNMQLMPKTAGITLLNLRNQTFECNFDDIWLVGNPALAGTKGINFTDAYINTFTNVGVLEFDKCLVFNTEANRNNFFGGSIRSNLSYGTVLVEHNAGQANSFTGTDLENCNRILDMNGGSLFFGEGCYFEAHNSAFGFELAGGHVGISRSYFNEVFMRLKSGGSLELARNWVKASSNSNASFPVIRTLSGFSRLILDNNILEGATYLARLDPTLYNWVQLYDEGTTAWSSNYPVSTQHIHIDDHLYDVTAAAIRHVSASSTRAMRQASQNYFEGNQKLDGGSNGVQLMSSAWNYNPLRLGSYYLWVDSTGDLRIKSGAPASELDGTVVGAQT